VEDSHIMMDDIFAMTVKRMSVDFVGRGLVVKRGCDLRLNRDEQKP